MPFSLISPEKVCERKEKNTPIEFYNYDKNKKINESTIFKLNRFPKLIEIVDKIYVNDFQTLNQLVRRALFTKF